MAISRRTLRPRTNSYLLWAIKSFHARDLWLYDNGSKFREAHHTWRCMPRLIYKFLLRIIYRCFRLLAAAAVKRRELGGFEQRAVWDFFPVRIAHHDVGARIIGRVKPKVERFCDAKG